MRQQAAQRHAGIGQEQGSLGQAAVVRFVMFQAEMRHMIAQRQQEMVVAIMPRPEKFARLGNQVGHLLLNRGAHVESGFAVRHHIDLMVDRLALGRQVDGAIILARNDGRIDEHIERNRLERDLIAGLFCHRKRRPELPAIRHQEFGVVHQLFGGNAGWIEDNLIPFQHQQLVRG